MKKLIFLMFLFYSLFLFGSEPIMTASDAENPVFSYEDTRAKGLISGWKFAPLQIGLGLRSFSNLVDEKTNTIITFGLLYMEQNSAVFSFALGTELNQNYGIQPGFLISASDNYGLMAGFTCHSHDSYGLKLGVINVKGKFAQAQLLGIDIADTVAIGLLHLEYPVPIGLCNLNNTNKSVFQAGIFNYSQSGTQLGVVNSGGVWQFGLFNHSKNVTKYSWEKPDQSGKFQFGLLNYNEKSYLPWLPLVNFDMGRGSKKEAAPQTKQGVLPDGEVIIIRVQKENR